MLLMNESVLRDLKNAHAQAIGFILSKTIRAFFVGKAQRYGLPRIYCVAGLTLCFSRGRMTWDF